MCTRYLDNGLKKKFILEKLGMFGFSLFWKPDSRNNNTSAYEY